MRKLGGRSWYARLWTPRPADDASVAEQATTGAVARPRADEALALLDASPDAIIGLDAYARVLFANAVAERTFGERSSVLVGTGADDLIPHLARAVTSLRMRIEAGDVVPGPAGPGTELAGVRADGARFPATVWLTPVRAGRRMLIAATVRDLTATRTADARARRQTAELGRVRQQAEHGAEQVAAILRAISERVVILADGSGMITAFNRAAERLLGYTAAEMIGQPTTRLSDPDELAAVAQELGIDPTVDPLLELTRSGLPNTQDWTYVTNRGERRPVSLRITAIGNRTDPSGFVCVAEDRSFAWSPVGTAAATSDRLLLDLDDAETRSLRWQVGGSRYARRS